MAKQTVITKEEADARKRGWKLSRSGSFKLYWLRSMEIWVTIPD